MTHVIPYAAGFGWVVGNYIYMDRKRAIQAKREELASRFIEKHLSPDLLSASPGEITLKQAVLSDPLAVIEITRALSEVRAQEPPNDSV